MPFFALDTYRVPEVLELLAEITATPTATEAATTAVVEIPAAAPAATGALPAAAPVPAAGAGLAKTADDIPKVATANDDANKVFLIDIIHSPKSDKK